MKGLKAGLANDQSMDKNEIREAISGQICRCTGYENIVQAVALAAERMGGSSGAGGSADVVAAEQVVSS